MAEYIVPVVAKLPTGTEGGNEMLWQVYPQPARGCEVLLAESTHGTVFIATIMEDFLLGFRCRL